MLLRELLPSVLLLELLLDDFENFNMEGKGEGVEKSFYNQGNPQDYVHFRLCTYHGTAFFLLLLLLCCCRFINGNC